MKVKEKYSNEFKIKHEEVSTKELRKDDEVGLMLVEFIYRPDYLPYSKYILRDIKEDRNLIVLQTLDPKQNDFAKDFYLKYQNAFKKFLFKVFDVLIGKEKKIKSQFATFVGKKDLIYEQGEDGIVWIYSFNNETALKSTVGYVDFVSKEESLIFGKLILDYFEGNFEEKICD